MIDPIPPAFFFLFGRLADSPAQGKDQTSLPFAHSRPGSD